MKIKLEVKETKYYSVEINTEDYLNAESENPFCIAELINSIKETPKRFIDDNKTDGDELNINNDCIITELTEKK